MKNHFLISDEEKNRIKNLHEAYKGSFGTGKLIKEAKWDAFVSFDELLGNEGYSDVVESVSLGGSELPDPESIFDSMNIPTSDSNDSRITKKMNNESITLSLPEGQYDVGDQVKIVLNSPYGFNFKGGRVKSGKVSSSPSAADDELGGGPDIDITLNIDEAFVEAYGNDFLKMGKPVVNVFINGNVKGGMLVVGIFFDGEIVEVEEESEFKFKGIRPIDR